MFLEHLDSTMSDVDLGATMLRANARAGIAGTAGSGMGVVAGSFGHASSEFPALVAVVVAATLTILCIAGFVVIARSLPDRVLGSFVHGAQASRKAGQPHRIITSAGATSLGLLAFATAFAAVLAS